MKDESRAQWPEGMVATRSRNGNIFAYRITGDITHDATVYSEDRDVIEARASQVRHLPAMVALLKVVARIEHPINSNAHLKAQGILRSIGEVE